MAGKDGHKTPALRESLLSEGHRYSFVQAYRLLRLLVLGTPSVTVGQGEARIAISPFLSSDSPETEVAAISACPSQEEEEYTISAPFPPAFREALSSLPASYSEDLLREISSGRTRARDSLELLARPLYRLFFDAWAKHRLSYGIIEKGDGDCLERLLCLAGIPFPSFGERLTNPLSLLACLGPSTQMPRSAEGLRIFLASALAEPTIRILECVAQRVAIPEDQLFSLGSQESLPRPNRLLRMRHRGPHGPVRRVRRACGGSTVSGISAGRTLVSGASGRNRLLPRPASRLVLANFDGSIGDAAGPHRRGGCGEAGLEHMAFN